MSISSLSRVTRSFKSKRRFDLHSEPQTWLGKLLNSEVDDDARNEVLKWLTIKEVMRTYLLSKSALTASMDTFVTSVQELSNTRDAAMAEYREKDSPAALNVAQTAIKEIGDVYESLLHLRYWRLRFASLKREIELLGEVDSLKMKVVALKRLYQSKP